mmetsp:Transcript_66545/g.160956  ORF Transcript_66545/g.160956 Transcript_66545/m.160956 type:complete len:219 (+) Transcript_66545:1306-1962(+)
MPAGPVFERRLARWWKLGVCSPPSGSSTCRNVFLTDSVNLGPSSLEVFSAWQGADSWAFGAASDCSDCSTFTSAAMLADQGPATSWARAALKAEAAGDLLCCSRVGKRSAHGCTPCVLVLAPSGVAASTSSSSKSATISCVDKEPQPGRLRTPSMNSGRVTLMSFVLSNCLSQTWTERSSLSSRNDLSSLKPGITGCEFCESEKESLTEVVDLSDALG